MKKQLLNPKDPASAITHFIAAILAIIAAIPLISKTLIFSNFMAVTCMVIFIISMILLYIASTIYHTFNLSPKINIILKKIDHMCIFLLIAGTYTPVCLIVLKGKIGIILLCFIWSVAILGIIFKAFWVTCPKWISSVIYIAMGWACVFSFTKLLEELTLSAFLWLLIGGIVYTVGGIIYALKIPLFDSKHKIFNLHSIFHIFVMCGSFCHFMLMYNYVSIM